MAYDVDFASRLLYRYYTKNQTKLQISVALEVSISYIDSVLSRWRVSGMLWASGNDGSLHVDRRVDAAAEHQLDNLLKANDSPSLADFVVALALTTGKHFSANDIQQALNQLKYSR